MSYTKRYARPARLADLHGPSSGTVELPIGLYWQPGSPVFDLGDPEDRGTVYRSVMNVGTLEDVCSYVNPELLVRDWPALLLPPRLVREWEAVSDELPHNVRGDIAR